MMVARQFVLLGSAALLVAAAGHFLLHYLLFSEQLVHLFLF
jgi:hypothetical protein